MTILAWSLGLAPCPLPARETRQETLGALRYTRECHRPDWSRARYRTLSKVARHLVHDILIYETFLPARYSTSRS
jgi:hypothetical protein